MHENLSSTGIAGLDFLCGGGIPRGSVVLILCDSGTSQDASALLGMLGLNLLERGETLILITTDPPSQTYPQLYAPEITGEAIKENRLFYIDLFSSSMGVSVPSNLNVEIVSKTNDLNHIMYVIRKFRNEKLKGIPYPEMKVTWIYNQFSTTIFSTGDPDKCLHFLWDIKSKIKLLNDLFFTSLNKEMHERSVVATAEHIADTVIELRSSEYKGIMKNFITVIKNAGLPCVRIATPYSLKFREREVLIGNDILSSFDSMKTTVLMDPEGNIRSQVIGEFGRITLLPAIFLHEIVRKGIESNIIEEIGSAIENASYLTAYRTIRRLKETFPFSEDELFIRGLETVSLAGWGLVEPDMRNAPSMIKVRVKNSIMVHPKRIYKIPVCFNFKGVIRGLLEATYEYPYVVEEVECAARGNENCIFIARRKT
ncbi:MAG: V4R domain-containing protein [Candidatus Jordarchaeales archaeon]